MSAELLVNVTPRETRVALIESGVLQEIFFDRANRRGLVGNIYKGRVCRVLPGMQAAFVDIGLDRAAFLHASDIADADAQQVRDAPAVGRSRAGRPRRGPSRRRCCAARAAINDLVRDGQEVLVQVIKDPLGTKGARLTTHVSIPSCFVVYMPGASEPSGSRSGSRTRTSAGGCARWCASARGARRGAIHAPGNGADEDWTPHDGYIVRTAAEGCPEAVVAADMAFLRKLWASVNTHAPPPSTAPASCTRT